MTRPNYPHLRTLTNSADARELATALSATRAAHPVEQAYLDAAALAARTLVHAGSPDEATRAAGMVEELLAAAETSKVTEVVLVEGRVDFQVVGQWLTVKAARVGVDRVLAGLRGRGERPEVVQLCRVEGGDVVEEWRP